jgi:hypothetical protein
VKSKSGLGINIGRRIEKVFESKPEFVSEII